MGFPVPKNAVKFSINGSTYCVAAFDWMTPIGNNYMIGIFELQTNGEWFNFRDVVTYMNDNDTFNDMQAKGGKVKYLVWLVSEINRVLKEAFATNTVPVGLYEPKDEAEARAAISNYLLSVTVDMSTGVPTVK